MLYLSENLKKYRILKEMTQEDVAQYLGITPQIRQNPDDKQLDRYIENLLLGENIKK